MKTALPISTGTDANPSPARKSFKTVQNPLGQIIGHGRMPVILEMHLTEGDVLGCEQLEQRHIANGAENSSLIALGQYLRELDVQSAELQTEERQLAKKLQTYADLLGSGKVDLLALDDGARGRDSLDNTIAAELLIGLGAEPGRLLASMVGRNRTAPQIRERLIRLAQLGLRNVLLLTGDLPVEKGKVARFPMDSTAMCALAQQMIIDGELPENFLTAAAGHPNPDVDPDGQLALQKALAGARLLITQVIYSVEEFQEWMAALRRLGVLEMVHVMAEIIPVTSSNQLRTISDVPGMRVPQELIHELATVEESLKATAQSHSNGEQWFKQRRAREGARVTRNLLHQVRRTPGVSGFYLGCIKSFDAHLELLKETPLLPESAFSPVRHPKLTGPERQHALAQLEEIKAFIDGCVASEKSHRVSVIRSLSAKLAQQPVVDKALRILEWPKIPMFGCKKCDRCDLSPDALICPRGCAKQMSHGPCGAPKWDGEKFLCEDRSRECTWAGIRERREQLGVAFSERLALKPPPATEFFQGKTFSSFGPVLAGAHPGPAWSLIPRTAWVRTRQLFSADFKLPAPDQPGTLLTLVKSKERQIRELLRARPEMDSEELLVKVLSLVGSPQALHLIETRLVNLGLPAEGTMTDTSIHALFRIAEVIPSLRQASQASPNKKMLPSRQQVLAAIPENSPLRGAVRRELASGVIRHIAAFGVSVTHAASLLEGKGVDDFLSALILLKDELHLVQRGGRSRTRLHLHFDSVHYKRHYRAPISLRRQLAASGATPVGWHIAVDIKQFGSTEIFRQRLREAFGRIMSEQGESHGELVLENFGPESKSVCWAFNHVFWQRLGDFERAANAKFDASIGGSTDHNPDFVRATARSLYDRIHHHGAGAERFFVLECGVASVARAKTFLEEMRRLCELHGTNYIENLTYVLSDYSEDILRRSYAELIHFHPHVETVQMDLTRPAKALEKYSGRIVHIHLCNVFDNLPCDRVAMVDGKFHTIESRTYVSRATLEKIFLGHGFSTPEREKIEAFLKSLDAQREAGVVELLEFARTVFTARGLEPTAYVKFWMDLIAALQMETQYLPYEADADTGGENHVAEIHQLISGQDRIEAHVSLAALDGFSQLLATLHPHGVLEVVDLFVQRIGEYLDRFKGPTKYDGSTVNWLNGPAFRSLAERGNYAVRFTSFKPFDAKSASVIMLASRAAEKKDQDLVAVSEEIVGRA